MIPLYIHQKIKSASKESIKMKKKECIFKEIKISFLILFIVALLKISTSKISNVGVTRSVMIKAMDSGIVISDFVLQ